jgi:steroid delta-isomerase-like uncharacterized protein
MKKSFRWPTKSVTAILLLALCLTFGCQQQSRDAITQGELNALNERILQIWNQGNLALVDEVYTAQVVRYDAGWPHPLRGLDALKSHFQFYRSAFPDIDMIIQETIMEADKIVWHWTLTGTNTGPMGESPPTGKQVRLSGISIGRIVDGKIAEVGDFYNQASLLLQLGFTFTPPQGE